MKLTCVLGATGVDCTHNKFGKCELNGIEAHLDYWAKGECMPKPICSEYKSKAVRCGICGVVLEAEDWKVSSTEMDGSFLCSGCYRILYSNCGSLEGAREGMKVLATRARNAQ